MAPARACIVVICNDLSGRAILPGLSLCFRILTGGEVTGKTGITAAGKSYHDNEEEVTEEIKEEEKEELSKHWIFGSMLNVN